MHLLSFERWLKLPSDDPPENLERALAVVFGERPPETQQTYSPAVRRFLRKKVSSCSLGMVLLLESSYDRIGTSPPTSKKQRLILSGRPRRVESA